MRFVPSALFALLTFALSVHSMPLTTSPSHLDAPASSKLGKYCTASTQCNSSTLFCNRNKCDTLRTISQSCYKDNGCTTANAGIFWWCSRCPCSRIERWYEGCRTCCGCRRASKSCTGWRRCSTCPAWMKQGRRDAKGRW
nr:hypothetical protein [Thecaphora frezii]